jgi:hypothetical protein
MNNVGGLDTLASLARATAERLQPKPIWLHAVAFAINAAKVGQNAKQKERSLIAAIKTETAARKSARISDGTATASAGGTTLGQRAMSLVRSLSEAQSTYPALRQTAKLTWGCQIPARFGVM